jgi:hypothetical protein
MVLEISFTPDAREQLEAAITWWLVNRSAVRGAGLAPIGRDASPVSGYRRRLMCARLLLLALSMLIGGSIGACQPNPTVFRGSAQFPGGPSACHARCGSDGLEMSGFVYSGDFATSCVCRPRGETAPVAAPPGSAAAPESAADPLADRGPGDASGTDLDSAADSAGAQVPIEAAAAAAAAAGARTQQQQLQQQQMLQHRKP